MSRESSSHVIHSFTNLCQFSVCHACPTLLLNQKIPVCPRYLFCIARIRPFSDTFLWKKTRNTKNKSLVQHCQIVCIFARKAERRATIFRIVRSGQVKKRVEAQWSGTGWHPMSIFLSAVRMCKGARKLTHATPRNSRRAPTTSPQKSSHVSFCHATNLADPHQIRPTEWSQAEKRQIMSESYSWNPVTLW